MRKDLIKLHYIGNQHLTRLRAFLRADDSGTLKLIHHTSCSCISHAQTPLKVGSGASLRSHYHPGGILEHRIYVLHIYGTAAGFSVLRFGNRQIIWSTVTLLPSVLVTDELGDLIDLVHADKSALHTFHLDSGIVKHITLTYQVLRTIRVEDSPGIRT